MVDEGWGGSARDVVLTVTFSNSTGAVSYFSSSSSSTGSCGKTTDSV